MSTSNINFNTAYGDINILDDKDIEIIRDYNKSTLQSVINLFKSSYNDYALDPNYSIDIDKYIGQPVSEALAERIKNTIAYRLEANNIINQRQDVVIIHLIDKNTIHLRIKLPGIHTSIKVDFLQDKGFEVEQFIN